MKQLSSIFYLFFLMVCFLSFFSSCEVDKEFLDAKDSGKQMKRQISFQKFKEEIGKTSFGNQMSISAARTGRTLEEFEIDTTLVKALETDKVVYTMKLEPKFEVADGKFYNLVVYKDNFDEIIKNIIEIHPQSELLGNTEPEIGTYLENSLKEIIYSSRLAPVEAPLCVAVDYQYLCYCGNHREGFCEGYCAAGFRWVPVLISVYCTSGGGESIPDEGYGGSSGDNGENFMLDPVLPSFDDVTPCQQLTNLMRPEAGNLKPDLDWLKTKVTETKEWGVEVEMRRINGQMTYPRNRIEPNTNNPTTVQLDTGAFIIGGCHNHPKNTYSIPSFGDVKWLRDCRKIVKLGREDEVFSIAVVKSNDGTINFYAMKINDYELLNNEVNAVWNNPLYAAPTDEEKLDLIHMKQAEKFKASNGQLEKSFLQQFGGFGIDLYKATDESLNEWKKLELGTNPDPTDPNQLIVVANPC